MPVPRGRSVLRVQLMQNRHSEATIVSLECGAEYDRPRSSARSDDGTLTIGQNKCGETCHSLDDAKRASSISRIMLPVA